MGLSTYIFLLLASLTSSMLGAMPLAASDGEDLTRHTLYMVPSPAVASLEQLLALPMAEWKAIPGDSINLGFHDNENYWFRIAVPECTSQTQKRVLDIAYPLLDNIELWAVDGQRVLSREQGGDRFPFAQRPMDYLGFAYSLGCETQQTVYLRINTTSAIQLPVLLWNEEDFIRGHSKLEKVFILYFGSMTVMLFYNFFLLLSVRKKIYLYYVFFLASYLSFQLGITGLGFSYLWPDLPSFNNYFIDKPLIGTFISSFLFAATFLETKERFPRLYKLMMVSNWVFACWIPISFFVSYSLSIRVVIVMIIYGIGVGFYLATASIMAGIRQGRFFAAAWTSWLIGTMVLALNKFGLIPRNLFTENAHQFGSIVEALLFSFALADQMNILRKSLAVVNRSLEKAIRHIEGENQRLESIVTERTADLRSKTRDLGVILENLPQGVLAFDGKGQILPTFSQSLTHLLAADAVAGADIFELLFDKSSLDRDAMEQIKATFQICFGEHRLNFDLNRAIFPDRISFDRSGSQRIFELGWSPLCSELDAIEYILLTISDVTELKVLEQQSHLLQQKSRILEAYVDGTLLRLRSFLAHGRSKLGDLIQVSVWDAAAVDAMFREIHTIKGNARTFRLNDLAQKAHDFEMDLSAGRDNPQALPRDRVRMHLGDMDQKMSALLEFVDALSRDRSLSSGEGQKASFDERLWQRFRNQLPELLPPDVLKKNLAELEYVRAAEYFQKLGDSCPVPGGKPAPEIACDIQSDLYLAEDGASRIQDFVVHLLRNSLDHGIEKPELRQQKGKPGYGRITFRMFVKNSRLVVEYSDDGDGLDLKRIKQKALDRKLCRDPGVSLAEAVNFIFLPGFSTAEVVSLTSGRGVGMDAVRQDIQALGGTLEWTQSIKDERMPFDIRITLGFSKFLVCDVNSKAA
ncbi:MAG TPA: 7TM diverse intracellular signaling domain-containing protein [Oligoflexus sp.]|uniref:7TM diverse intracellular signaling domain-containing protein n=1 Tax=Oligoflexus sp. TaxID=1971216 RepID=UPI002D80C02C|nr:7TM diverse intracellular signaling domain-containing protein [Oligoflexus sp.]HET9238286.1 7TM diverse intracellular signaling domain-containing protein [Oligoflexus sp.]